MGPSLQLSAFEGELTIVQYKGYCQLASPQFLFLLHPKRFKMNKAQYGVYQQNPTASKAPEAVATVASLFQAVVADKEMSKKRKCLLIVLLVLVLLGIGAIAGTQGDGIAGTQDTDSV